MHMTRSHPDKNFILGIDVGTSGCKVLLADKAGTVRASAVEPYPLTQPRPGWTEQDPRLWWNACCAACRRVMNAGVCDGSDIAAVGLTGQMHSLVALDERMDPIRPAILWNDQRTTAQCREIQELSGGLDGLLNYTNNMMLTGYTGGKLLWLREHEPENFCRLWTVLMPKDYLRYQLTGVLMTDVSDASGTGLFDVQHRRWATELLDRLALPESIFPPVCESPDITGTITEAAAISTGLAVGTPVCGGGGDAVLSLLSAGIARNDRLGVTLGTSGVVAAPIHSYRPNPEGKLQMFCGTTPGTWAAIGCTLAAAGSYHWFCQALGTYELLRQQQEGVDAYILLDEQAHAAPAGCGGLLYFPYLMGERCPLFDADARGAFWGIDSTMDKGHFARAVLEGVAYSLRQVYDLTRSPDVGAPEYIVVCGGGSKSGLWRQILADVFQLPVCTTGGAAEGSAYGAALLAGVAGGFWHNTEEAAAQCRLLTRLEPCLERRDAYEKQYARYCALYRFMTNKER